MFQAKQQGGTFGNEMNNLKCDEVYQAENDVCIFHITSFRFGPFITLSFGIFNEHLYLQCVRKKAE